MSGRRQSKKTTGRQTGRIELEVLVEEESAQRLLRAQLQRWVGDERVSVGIRAFQGKPDLLRQLEKRLKGYAERRAEGADVRVVVLVDRDEDDCTRLKRELDRIANRAGLPTRSSGKGLAVVNRIAIRELENWFYGDWQAVRAAYQRVPERAPAAYRNNADCASAKTSDNFGKILERAGVNNMSKPDWADRIGRHMCVEANRSPSFQQFVAGVRKLVSQR